MGRLGYYSKLSFQPPEEVIPKKIFALGDGCVKIMRIVSCLEWLTCLFLFTIRLNLKVTVQPRLNNSTHFSCYESLPKRVQCLTPTWDFTSRNGRFYGSLSMYRCPFHLEKVAPWRFLFSIVSLHAVCLFYQSSTFYFFKRAIAFREGAEDFEGGTYWPYFGKQRSRKNYWRQDASCY